MVWHAKTTPALPVRRIAIVALEVSHPGYSASLASASKATVTLQKTVRPVKAVSTIPVENVPKMLSVGPDNSVLITSVKLETVVPRTIAKMAWDARPTSVQRA